MSKRYKMCVYYEYMLCKTFLHTLVFQDASSPLFLKYCIIDIFRFLRQSFCGKFKIVCGFWNPANPAFRMYGKDRDWFHAVHIDKSTSDLEPPKPSKPPITLTLPPTIEAWALYNNLGSDARGAQAVDPGRRVSTLEKPLNPSVPPATSSAWRFI